MEDVSTSSDSVLKFCVGGEYFKTTRHTVCSKDEKKRNYFDVLLDPERKFSVLMDSDDENCFFIDREPRIFRSILHYLRTGSLVTFHGVTKKDVLQEMEFFGIDFKEVENIDQVITVHIMGPPHQHNFVKALSVEIFGKCGKVCSDELRKIIESYDPRKKNAFEVAPSKADISSVLLCTHFDHNLAHRISSCLTVHGYPLVSSQNYIVRNIEHQATQSEYDRLHYIMHFRKLNE